MASALLSYSVELVLVLLTRVHELLLYQLSLVVPYQG